MSLRPSFALVLLAPVLTAQAGKKPEPQPRDLVLGSLRQDTRVEASFLVTWNDGAKQKPQKPTKVTPPPFVKILRTSDALDDDGLETKVWLRIRTRELGGLKGSIRIQHGDRQVAIPVDAVVLTRDPLSTRVLVAESPFEMYSTDNSDTFTAWREIVATGKLEPHYLTAPEMGSGITAADLAKVDVVLLGETALLQLTATERALVQGFVCGGGRLVVAASRFFAGTVPAANRVIAPFGLEMIDAEPKPGPAFELDKDHFAKHRLTEKLELVKVRRPSPVRIKDAKRATALVTVPGFPDETGFVAAARTDSGGEVVVLGVALWWNFANNHAGNVRLLRNMLVRRR